MELKETPLNILLVDDKPENLVALRSILDVLGHNLVEVHSGDEALRKLLTMDFAVILLDVQMPGLNGFETATLIRQRQRSEHTPIIFISAFDDPEFSPAKAYTLGAVDYLQKPLEPLILRAKVEGLVAVAKETQRARRQGELLRLIIEGAKDHAIIMLDPQGLVATWNPGAERIYGYKVKEISGQHFSRFYPGVDVDNRKPWHELEVAGAHGTYEEEGWRLRKDGSPFWASVVISPLCDETGKLQGYSKITRDITERREAEENARRLLREQAARAAAEASAREARESAEALRFLAEASKVIAELLDPPNTLRKVADLAVPHFADWCVVDMVEPDGSLQRMAVAHADPQKVELAHKLERRLLPNPAVPVGAANIVRTGTPELLAEIPDSFLAGAAAADETLAILRQLGLHSYIGVPLQVRGRVIGVMTFVSAESGRRYRQRDLDVAQDLASRVAIAIENSQLYAEAKEADRRKDEFLAMLGHELRNPLAPMANALHLLSRPNTDPAVAERARDIMQRQFRHLTRLVDDLLDVSRIMRGKIELRKEPVPLSAIVAGGIEVARPMIEAHAQQLIVELPDEPLLLDADPTRLTQVVANLLHNAAKYSDKPGRISVRGERSGDKAVLRIKDEGAGISPSLLPKIFDLFVQGDRSLERSQGGLGIGLTVVHKLIEMHGGAITAHSAGQGQGSEFAVYLPILEGAALPAAEPSPPETTSPPRRVLVVDDNVDAAESLGMLLREAGHRVFLAHSGQDALRAAHAHDPEFIVLDIGLPEMNGYEVARALREQPRFQKTVLVALTGYGQEDDRRRSHEAGFNHHLVKPIKSEALRRLIAGNGAQSAK